MLVEGVNNEGKACQFEGTVKGFEPPWYDVRGSDENFPEGPFDASQLTRCGETKTVSNDSFYKSKTCLKCGSSVGMGSQPKGTLCPEDSTKLWQIRYDEASDTTTFVDQQGVERQFTGKVWPDEFYIHPDSSPRFAALVLPTVTKWREREAEKQQDTKRRQTYHLLERSKRQAEEKRRLHLAMLLQATVER